MIGPRVAEEILPPAFYPVSLNLAGRCCIVIGEPGDREAVEKSRDLREAGADVRRLLDPAAVTEADLAGAFFVVSTPQDARLSAWLRELADRRGFLLCAIDQPAFGFVAMPATVKAGRARIAISTGGVSPRVAALLKAALQSALDATFARFLECLAHQRRLNRKRNAGDAQARRATMMAAAAGFGVDVSVTYPAWFLEELAALRPAVRAEEPRA